MLPFTHARVLQAVKGDKAVTQLCGLELSFLHPLPEC